MSDVEFGKVEEHYRQLVEADHPGIRDVRLSYGSLQSWEPGAAPLVVMGTNPRVTDVEDFPCVEFTDIVSTGALRFATISTGAAMPVAGSDTCRHR